MNNYKTDGYSLLLSKINSFSKISNDDWEMVAPFLETKTIRKNEFFIREGKRAYEIGFVLEGTLRQFYIKDGEEKTTYFFFENDFISSYISCITNQPSHITIEALSTVTYVSFPYSILLDGFNRSMAWQKFGRVIAEYLMIGLEERMVGLLMKNPEERYVDLLKSNKQRIIERIPQHYIANYLGITPVSMSRIRSRLLKK